MLFATLRNLLYRRSSQRPGPLRRRLLVEALEERNVPSGGPQNPGDFKNPPSPIGTTFSTDANVKTDVAGDIHNETAIAVNPTNPLNLISCSNEYQGYVNNGGQLAYTSFVRPRVTFDGGHTWTTYPIPFRGYNFTPDPSVSFDADGTAYIATLGKVVSQNGLQHTEHETGADIVVSRSADGGRTWSAPVRVATGRGGSGENEQAIDNDKSYLTAWGHGNAIVTWTQFTWGPAGRFINQPIFASVTHDGGSSWTDPVQISGALVIDQASVPAVAADGSVHVAFLSGDNELAPEFRDHYEVVRVNPATGQALGAPVEVGLVYDGIHDYPVNVQGQETYQDSQFRTDPWGNLATDPTNPLHLAVVWSDMRSNPYQCAVLPSLDPYQVQTNSDVIVSQSFDGGASWSAPVALAAANDQFMPWGAYDASGRLRIGYYDRSYDPANHAYGYSLASETAPGTLDFAARQVTTALSDPTQGDAFFAVTADSHFPSATTFLGDYSGIAVTPTGVAVLWTDMRLPSQSLPGSGEDVFFALVDPFAN
jgi:hypothetical protein